MDVALLVSFSLLVFLNSSLAFSNHVLGDLQANNYQDTATKLYEITYIVMTGRRWLREMSTEKIHGMEKPHFALWGTHEGYYLESRKKFESSRGQYNYQKDDKSTASMQISATARRYLKTTTSQNKRPQDAADQTFTVIDQDYTPTSYRRRRSPVHN